VAAHAQRMSSLLASDKGALCRESKGGARTMGGEVRAGRRGGGVSVSRRRRRAHTGPD
jgi:hypothetical protein